MPNFSVYYLYEDFGEEYIFGARAPSEEIFLEFCRNNPVFMVDNFLPCKFRENEDEEIDTDYGKYVELFIPVVDNTQRSPVDPDIYILSPRSKGTREQYMEKFPEEFKHTKKVFVSRLAIDVLNEAEVSSYIDGGFVGPAITKFTLRSSSRELSKLILNAIELVREVERANSIHPPMNSAHEGYAIIDEEFDELRREVFKGGSEERSVERMRSEAIQVGAMALKFINDVTDKEV